MEDRAATRFVSDVIVDCHSIGTSARAILYDVSTAGCMLELPAEIPPEWEFVCLKIDDLAIDGHIVWRFGCHAGVQFHLSLHPEVVAGLSFKEPLGKAKAA